MVVEVAGRESVALPSIEVVGDGDSAASALALADREVLAESAGALDGRLVDLGVLADLVGRAVAGDATDGLGAADRARVVAVVLHDVVLCIKISSRGYDGHKTPGKLTRQRTVQPAVYSKVRALVGGVAATVIDDSANIRQSMIDPLSRTQAMVIPVGRSSAPTKSDYEVAGVVPAGSERSCAFLVLEVGKVAIVVLDIANGLTALKLVVELLLCRLGQSNRRGSGRAKKSEKSGRELHVVVMMIEEGREIMMFVIDSKGLGALNLLLPYTRQPGMTSMAQLGAIQPERGIESKLKH